MTLFARPELLTNAEMAEADRLTIVRGTPGSFLMEQAGAAVAREAEHLLARHGRIVVFCGPGNNGGDGFVAARLLAAKGYHVEVGLLGRVEALHGDAARGRGLDGQDRAGRDLALEAPILRSTRSLAPASPAISTVRPRRWSHVSMNGPQRQESRSSQSMSPPESTDRAARSAASPSAPRAPSRSFAASPAMCCCPAASIAARRSSRISEFPSSVLATIAPKTFVNSPAAWQHAFPVPRIDGHKYSRGHALVLSGGLAHTGAARLAARGALRAGAGLVTVATPKEALAVHAAALTAIMTRACDGPDDLKALLADRRKNALVMGPGLGVGEATRALVPAALAGENGGALAAPRDRPRRRCTDELSGRRLCALARDQGVRRARRSHAA